MAKFIFILLAFSSAAIHAEDFKVIKLEQDVRNLERQVQDLSRQLDEVRRNTRMTGARSTAKDAAEDGVQRTSNNWLSADNWKRVRAGMSELEVIDLLGPPTSLRGDANSGRTLFYAMEIGSSGFLSGSVRLNARKVVEVQIPTLK
jgi:hypothetical protein